MMLELSRAPLSGATYSAVEYEPERDEVILLEQRLLPGEVSYRRYSEVGQVAGAITDMVVRGAPAIGIAAAYALALCARRSRSRDVPAELARAAELLGRTRPTAVNLRWALSRMVARAAQLGQEREVLAEGLLVEAETIHREDVAACQQMGALGARDVPDGATVLTHCNAGALATGGFGTALGVIRAAHQSGKRIRVLADETRPYLQGARLTAWELHQDGIPVEVISDSMAAHFFQRGEIQFVVVGSDRVAANGDIANKIGTYGVAVLAREHGVPFSVAAPTSTIDMACPAGSAIPIEERSREEMARLGATVLVADGIPCRHPAFDVTPARLVDAVYTELGRFRPRAGETPSLLGLEPALR